MYPLTLLTREFKTYIYAYNFNNSNSKSGNIETVILILKMTANSLNEKLILNGAHWLMENSEMINQSFEIFN